MLQFPRLRATFGLCRKTSAAGFIYHWRNTLALILMALLFFAPSGSRVSAQQQEGAIPGSTKRSVDHFINYVDANGELVCRAATLAEQRELNKINTANLGMHVIAPNRRASDSKTRSDDAANINVEPQKIILRATQQLESFPEARAAFLRAAMIWEAKIQSPVKIYIDVDFGPTRFGQAWPSSNPLGSTSSPAGEYVYQNVRQSLIAGASRAEETALYNSLPATSLPTNNGEAEYITVSDAIARALGLMDQVAAETDVPPVIGFNSIHPFDFDPTNGIDSDKYDFEAVAVHEIGHALGFISRAGRTDGSAPAVWDMFRFREGTKLDTFGTAQRIMTPEGLQYYYRGGRDLGLATGGSNGQAPGGDGIQSSHWKNPAANFGQYIGIMSAPLGTGARWELTYNDTNALNFFGYQMDTSGAPPPPPANDNYASRQLLVGCTGSVDGTNLSSTRELNEPYHHAGSGASAWYEWQAPATGEVVISTKGARTNYNSVLAVYTGDSLVSLQQLNRDDGYGNESELTFYANAGTIYKIAVDGYIAAEGNFVLNWTQGIVCAQATTQLSQGSYQIAEGGGSVQVVVNRTDTTAAINIDYATSDNSGLNSCNNVTGLASSRCDYATSVGTLRFAVGEASKTIFIPVIDDNITDGDETFNISLKIRGNTLATATITITDNANSTGNPIDTAEFFIREHYIDFLGREPESSGLAGWLNVYHNCGTTVQQPCDRTEISSAFFRSEEFQTRAYLVYRFYSAVGKIPLYEDFMPDFAKVSGFLSSQQLEENKVAFVNEFMTRPDYQNKYGGLADPTAYVDALLKTVGLPNHQKRTLWIVSLTNATMTKAQVLRALVESTEVYNKYYNEAFVIMQYFGYLRRSADISYLNWIQTMNTNGGNYRQMIDGFLNSAAYRNRFGQ